MNCQMEKTKRYTIYTKTVHLDTPGTLSQFLSEDERQNICALKITGFINHKDFEDVLDDMCDAYGLYDEDDFFQIDIDSSPKLRYLDLGECTYTETGFFPDLGTNSLLNTLIMPQGVECFDIFCQCDFPCLEKLVLPEGISNINGIANGSKITKIKLPDSIKTIEHYAFSDCKLLQELHIPKNVAMIQGTAFLGSNIHLIISDATEPPLIIVYNYKAMIRFFFQKLKVIVPSESVEKYRNAPFWNEAHVISGKHTKRC